MIQIYTVPDCKFCKRAKELMKKLNVEYEEINLKEPKNRKAREFYRSLGVKTAPIIKGPEFILTEYNEELFKDLIEDYKHGISEEN